MTGRKDKNLLERCLTLFTEVRAGEGVTAILLTLNVFLVLTSYYIAKPVRESWILVEGGAELKSYLSAALVLLLFVAVRLYAWLASKFSRRRLINVVNTFFSGCLVLFFVLAAMKVPLGITFFLWVGMFNVMVVAQFWSFANDIYTPEEGKRLFALVAFGAASGSVVGASLVEGLVDIVGLNQLLLAAAGVLMLSLVITNIVDTREKVGKSKQMTSELSAEKPVGTEGAFRLLFENKYLLMIAFLILLLNWVNTTGEYILGKIVVRAAQEMSSQETMQKAFVAKFYGEFFKIVNFAVLLIQLFLVSRIFKYLGIRVAILILPLIALGGYLLLAFYPVLSFVRWAKTAENATDYSLNNTVRHALFLPTSRDEKYKAKQAVDSFFHRSGDVLSALVVFVGTQLLAFKPGHFAIFNLILVVIWLALAFRIGQLNKKLIQETEGIDESQVVAN